MKDFTFSLEMEVKLRGIAESMPWTLTYLIVIFCPFSNVLTFLLNCARVVAVLSREKLNSNHKSLQILSFAHFFVIFPSELHWNWRCYFKVIYHTLYNLEIRFHIINTMNIQFLVFKQNTNFDKLFFFIFPVI